ncbi:MAG: FAD-dependent oxidoreductase [Thermoplasmatales archaeon]|nr:FAD-dependent oxidoreductase [Candidatus Thermoplasmatota archaeon]MDA8055169.1 FAD-dependent oxidoreductase [Thermoplasmatales archaeon]
MNYSRVPIKHFNPDERVKSLDVQTLVPYTLDEVTAEASRCLGCGLCVEGCPARIDVPGFQIAVKNGNIEEGLKINFEKLPFVGVCGSVCPHPCEDNCILDDNKGPVATRHIKRFISENSPDYKQLLGVVQNDLGGHPKVAIIGGGPSGLSTAFYLSINGIQVDVFEATDRPGGMMVHGIPDFRLSRETVQKEADHVLSYGARIFYNTKIGRDVKFEDLMEKYDAVYIAIGNWKPSRTKIPGAELKGVYHAIDFLGQVNNGKKLEVGDTVAIIGGGFTAFDAARISLRLGAKKVIVMYRRAVTDRPGYPSSNAEEELDEAEEEKVQFIWEVTPTEYYGENGKVKGIKYWKNQMVDKGTGRREPVPMKDKEYTIEVDTLIEATGQKGDLSFIPENIIKKINLTPSGDLIVNQYNMTSYPGIFAGGDVTNARKDIISGVADSGRASMGILFYFKDKGKIDQVPAKLINFESGPYAVT